MMTIFGAVKRGWSNYLRLHIFGKNKGNPQGGLNQSNSQATTRLINAGRIVLSRQSDTRVVAIIS